MRLENIIAAATNHLVGRLLRRALIVVMIGICAIIAFYHFTIAGNIALAGQFGDLDARLIIGGLYAAAALISFAILWAMRGKSARPAGAPALSNPREVQLVMLVEAVMLGYALARKGERAR
jgi:type VI protein secretion system component VasK